MDGKLSRLRVPRWGVLAALAVLLGCLCSAAAEAVAASPASAPYIPRTSRRYTMMVEELTGSLDEEGSRPTLVSVTDEMSLTLPVKADAAAAAWEGDAEGSEIDEGAAARLTFDENFDPIWYYVLRRRGFAHVDWSGCGGKWRPEWSLPRTAAAGDAAGASGNATAEAEAFQRLHHYLAHHAVCTYSSVSFCGASRERDAASQFQWAAQFISTLTSSPLSWTDATPRHLRPNGVVLQHVQQSQSSHNRTTPSIGEAWPYWCSYHLVYHDTLCTQHVSPLLNGGRSGRGVQEGLPPGIFKAAFPSFVKYFGAAFQHFTVKATQQRRPAVPAAGTPPTVRLTVEIRMTMVTGAEADLRALADVWTRELPAYARAGRLQVRVGPGGLSRRLRAALPAAALADSQASGGDAGDVAIAAAAGAVTKPIAAASRVVGRAPEVQYDVHAHGKVYGYLTVSLQPALALLDPHAGVEAAGEHDAAAGDAEGDPSATSFVLQEGDVVRTLLLFPLHLVRPSLYDMESLLGSTRIVHAHTDIVSNTLAVLLETRVTAVHVAAYEAALAQSRVCHQHGGAAAPMRRCATPEGVLLGRFRLFFGWAALSEMPPDDNSNRLVPQPVVAIHRAASSAFCQARQARQRRGVPQLDHEASLTAVFQLLNGTFARADAAAPSTQETCVYWVRSTVASGTTIPGPDGAMVFNVLSLGLVFSAIGAGMLTRVTRRLTYRKEDLAAALE